MISHEGDNTTQTPKANIYHQLIKERNILCNQYPMC